MSLLIKAQAIVVSEQKVQLIEGKEDNHRAKPQE
jgi:hypothetical protein